MKYQPAGKRNTGHSLKRFADCNLATRMGHKALSPWNHGGGGGDGGGCGGGSFISKHIELIQYHHYRHTLWKKMITVEV